MKKRTKKGFTIVELVIVIAVIGILAAVLIPTFGGVIDKANKSAALQEATSVMTATLAMSQTATLAEDTIFVIGDSKGVTYEFKYVGNKITEIALKEGKTSYETLTPAHGGTTTTSLAYDRIIINSDLVKYTGAVYTWAPEGTQTVIAIIKDVFNVNSIQDIKIRGKTEVSDMMKDSSATCACEIKVGAETYYIAVYVNSDYPTDAVTFVPATQENDVTGGNQSEESSDEQSEESSD